MRVPGTLLTSAQAAKLLGVSRQTLGNWRRSGRLTPVEVRGNQPMYSPLQIDYARRETATTIAAQAFELFESGRSAVQVVIALKADPADVKTWHAHYVDLSGSWLVQGPTGSRLVWERSYKIGELTGEKIRRALELCSADPKLRARLLDEQTESN